MTTDPLAIEDAKPVTDEHVSTPTTRVAEAVREAVAARGISQIALSEATGIPRVTLIRRLNGHSPFTIAELAAIAEHLGVTVSDLVAVAA